MKILNKTATFKNRTIANYVGNFVSIFSYLVFFPLYIKIYDINQFSLITFASTILALFLLFDFGFGAVLRREFAIESDSLEHYTKRNLFFISIERLYAATFVIIIFIILLLNTKIKIILSQFASIPELEIIVGLICTMSFFQLYSNLYVSILSALNKHVVLNVIQTIMLLSRNGLVIVVSFYSNSVLYFFLFQFLVMLVHVIILRRMVYFVAIRKIKFPKLSNFIADIGELKNYFKIGLTFFTMSLLSTLNYQIDKLFIVNKLSAEDLGSYNTALVLSQVMVNLALPIIGTLSPLIIGLHNSESYNKVKQLFIQYTVIFNLIAGIILALFFFHSNFLIGFWIGENDLKNSISNIILYLLGSSTLILNQLLPYQVSIAYLNFRKVVIFGFFNFLIIIPLYYFGIHYWGIKGVAIVWLISNSYLTIVNNYFYLSPLYNDLFKKSLFQISILPLIVSFLFFTFFNTLKPNLFNPYLYLITICTIALFSLLGSGFLYRKTIFNR
jgi:O-antigen/teichoic acid export membrane protein